MLDAASYTPGSMVRARGREWIVLPTDDDELLRLRPLGGTDEDACGIYLPIEGDDVAPARLDLPDPRYWGNSVSIGLLRNAVRLGFRSAAGPLRSIARIAVEPRPYQIVPLLMALRLDPVRILIGDDVGIGKTIESALIARELLDRGEIRRLCVLCPPHLCEQWRKELSEKFHLPAVEVRPGTIGPLERDLPVDRSIFVEHPVTVVSIDFIKSDRRREQFIQTCPEFVIVDEAHTAALSSNTAQQHRHRLLRDLAANKDRHLLLVTATPHSGDEQAFASLIGLLDPGLESAVATLQYGAGTEARRRLARHFVQRRRGDITHYLRATTVFPERDPAVERPYRLTPEYRSLLERTRSYTQELVQSAAGLSHFHQRIRWWAALALLRCVSSSPAAAAAALRTRAAQPQEGDLQTLERMGRDAVFDQTARDEAEQDDATPGADTVDDERSTERRRLLDLARFAEQLGGDADPKLKALDGLVRQWVKDGFHPIVFCRYVATAHYVADELRRRLPDVRVEAVTGELPPEERADRVDDLGRADRRVLVATDCLSEGINLQQRFDAVIHYDLAWNPTRHEQREGRVDRYGQPQPRVRTALIYGQDNQVDGVVLKVLLRKAESIRKTLGVMVPVPVDSTAVLEAILEALILRPDTPPEQLSLFFEQEEQRVNTAWTAAANREERTRTVFAQHGIKQEEVEPELEAARAAAGTGQDVERFLVDACAHFPGARFDDGRWQRLDLAKLPAVVRLRAGFADEPPPPFRVGFELPVPDGVTYLPRTHPIVEALAGYVLDTALADPEPAIAKRCALVRTDAVTQRTVLLLLRARFLIERHHGHDVFPMLAEDCLLAAFEGDPEDPGWLDRERVEALTAATPLLSVSPGEPEHWIGQVLAARHAAGGGWWPRLRAIAGERAQEVLDAHQRVRTAAQLRGVRYTVRAHDEVDLLGICVLLPVGGRR